MNFMWKFAVSLVGSVILLVVIGMIANGVYNAGRTEVAAAKPSTPEPAAKPTAAATPAAAPPAAPAAPAIAASAGASIAVRLAAADPALAATVRIACVSCHTFDKGGANRVGPNLWGVVERPKGSVAGFGYSDAIKKQTGGWTFADLDRFLTSPKDMVPGTKMTFPGIADPAARANLIAFLRTQADAPVPLPAP